MAFCIGIIIIISMKNWMEKEKLALGHIQEICSSLDLLTSFFLRIRINKYNCQSEMGRGEGKKIGTRRKETAIF